MPRSENRFPFVVALIVAVEGGVKGRGHYGTDGILKVRLGGALRGWWRGAGRFRFVQRLIRDLQAGSGFIDDRRECLEGGTHRQSHDIRH